MLQKARDLSQAIQILKHSEKSEVVKAIYETPPSTPTVSLGRTFLNKDLQATKQISKKLLIWKGRIDMKRQKIVLYFCSVSGQDHS